MKAFVKSFGQGLKGSKDEAIQEERTAAKKVPEAVIKRREEQRLLGLLDSDEEDTWLPTPLAKKRELDARTKGSPIEVELNNWYRYHPQQPVNNPLQFWIDMAKDRPSNRFPLLTKLALDIYSIPAMSSECEQVFSQTKRVITDDRNCFSATTIKAVQCQRNWLAQKVVHSDLEAAMQRLGTRE